MASRRHDRIDVLRRQHEVDGKAETHGKHEERQQGAQLFGPKPLADPHAILSTDDAGDHQLKRENDIDRVVQRRLDHRRIGGHEDDLEKRCPMTTPVGTRRK